MDIKTVKKLISAGENSSVELKLSFSDEVIISLVAFANHNCGVVIIGISDNKEVKGLNLSVETLQHWVNEIRGKTQPFLSVEIEKYIIDNKTIVVFEFEISLKTIII